MVRHCGQPMVSPCLQLVPDGSGGAIITWVDNRDDNSQIYAQRIDANGSALWAANGIAVCTAATHQYGVMAISDGSGGAIITWQGDRFDGLPDIYAQRIDTNGSALWAANGDTVCTADLRQCVPVLTSDGQGGAIIAWWDDRFAFPNYDIYAQRISSSGSGMWEDNGQTICTHGGNRVGVQLISDGSGGAILTFSESYGTRAQRVDGNGWRLWNAEGVAICTASGIQLWPQLIPDGSGGAIIAWCDDRSGNDDIYAQRVDAAGHTVVATLLQNYAATFFESGIALTWTLSEVDEGVEFSCGRSTASNGPYIELPSSTLTRDDLSFSFIDKDWEPNTTYWYRVECSSGGERKILFVSGPVTTPAMPLTLYQNSPNPFNPSTEIRYYLPEKCSVALNVYDVSGALVANVTEGYQDKGTHTVSWDGRGRNGRQASSGVYFYRLKAGKTEISKKMVLTR